MLARLLLCLLSFVSLGPLSGCSGKGVVATVNGKDISQEEFVSQMTSMDSHGMKTLSWLITYYLLISETEKKNIKIDDAEVDHWIGERQKRLGLNPTDWKREARQTGNTVEDLRREMRFELAMHKLITEGIKVSNDELKKIYDTNQQGFLLLQFARIVLGSQAEAREVYQRLSEGGQFASLAKERSLDPPQIRENAGSIGPLAPLESWDPHYLQAVQGLPLNTPSRPFRHQHTQSGQQLWEIVKVVKQEQMKFEDYKEMMRWQIAENKATQQGRTRETLLQQLYLKANVAIKDERMLPLESQFQHDPTARLGLPPTLPGKPPGAPEGGPHAGGPPPKSPAKSKAPGGRQGG